MRGELTGSVPATRLTLAQRARWNEATARAHARTQALAHVQPPPARVNVSLDVSVPRIPTPPVAPSGFSNVAAADVPRELWYYGRKPFKYSSLRRMPASGGHGFSPNWAQIDTEIIRQDVRGIRLTTVPPTAPIAEIRAAIGEWLPRGSAFAVRIRPQNLLTIDSKHFPRANLLMESDRPGRYVLRPSDRTSITLHGDEHTVMSSLP